MQQQAYMRSTTPNAGVTAHDLRRLCKAIFRQDQHLIPDAATWEAAIAKLWREARVREERHAALELLDISKYRKAWLNCDRVPLLQEMITSGAWWDYVDVIATRHIGFLLTHFPDEMMPTLKVWQSDPDLWLRRTTILAQLKFKDRTDLKFLNEAIQGSIADNDFFARKAIGWALREYSKTDPEWVINYVEANQRLSGLSKREALKIINRK